MKNYFFSLLFYFFMCFASILGLAFCQWLFNMNISDEMVLFCLITNGFYITWMNSDKK